MHGIPYCLGAFACALILITPQARGQQRSSTSEDDAWLFGTLNEIHSARSAALGEATAAFGSDPDQWSSNPASAVQDSGAGMIYRHDEGRGFVYDGSFNGSSAWIGTHAGTIAFHFTTFDPNAVTISAGTDTLHESYSERSFGITYAAHVLGPLTAGVGVQLLQTTMLGLSSAYAERSPTYAYVDLGLQASFGGAVDDAEMRDSVHLGIAAQHFGPRFTFFDAITNGRMPIAQWLRAGAAYDLIWPGADGHAMVKGSLAAEFRRLLNPSAGQHVSGATYTSLDQWGMGMEMTLGELVTLRGGLIVPYRGTSFGARAKASFRYGLGVTFPFQRFDLNVPLVFGVDYAHLPVDENNGVADSRISLEMLAIRIVYTASIF